jgi:hypothetical protein
MQLINDLLDAKLVKEYKTKEKRNYLGASSVGDECARRAQLQYLHKEQDLSAQTLRTLDIGNYLEGLILK